MYTSSICFFFFFNDTATTEIYTLSLHDALPISRYEVVQRHHGRASRPPPVYEQRPALRQHPTGDDLREAQAPGIEHHSAGDRIEHDEQAGARGFHEQGALDHADAVGRQPAQLGFLPRDLTALDVDPGELRVGRDEERSRRRDLLPADVPLRLDGPRRGRA